MLDKVLKRIHEKMYRLRYPREFEQLDFLASKIDSYENLALAEEIKADRSCAGGAMAYRVMGLQAEQDRNLILEELKGKGYKGD